MDNQPVEYTMNLVFSPALFITVFPANHFSIPVPIKHPDY